jgi:Ni/Fe-hydrogenase subunit HybB-like protein
VRHGWGESSIGLERSSRSCCKAREGSIDAGEIKTLDRRLSYLNWSISLSVFSAVLICVVVALLFAATLFEPDFGRAIALLFIGSMIAIGIGFAVFLVETRLASRSMRIRPEVLGHAPDEQ